MKLSVFKTKKAIALYLALVVLLASAFGFGESVCEVAKLFEFDTLGMCSDVAGAE